MRLDYCLVLEGMFLHPWVVLKHWMFTEMGRLHQVLLHDECNHKINAYTMADYTAWYMSVY